MDRKIGCTAIQGAIQWEYLEVINAYTKADGDETRPVLTFAGTEDNGNPIMVLKYCPFCGTPFKNEMPSCASKVGLENREIREVSHD